MFASELRRYDDADEYIKRAMQKNTQNHDNIEYISIYNYTYKIKIIIII